eukprot:1190277-Prorocentrum_minimum.AAC.11
MAAHVSSFDGGGLGRGAHGANPGHIAEYLSMAARIFGQPDVADGFSSRLLTCRVAYRIA